VNGSADDDARRHERMRRRTAKLDREFAFSAPGGGDCRPTYTRGEAEQRASTLLAKLPALPAIVLEASKPAGASVEGLEAAVEKDPSLAAMVLAVGGSSFFRGDGPPARNLAALMEQVGTAAFRGLTFVAAFRGIFGAALPWYGYGERGLWRHLVGTAVAARKLGRAMGLHKLACETLFLAGMLHDIGKPTVQGLLDSRAPSAEAASQGGTLTVLEAELRAVNMTHTELVPLILDIWGVEHDIFAMTEHHHAPQRAGAHAVQASLLQLADVLANLAGTGLEHEYGFSNVPLEKAAGRLNLSLELCRSVQEELGWTVAEIATEADSAAG